MTEAQGLGLAQEGAEETPSVPRLGAALQCCLPALVRDQATGGRGGGAQRAAFCPPGEPLPRPTPTPHPRPL